MATANKALKKRAQAFAEEHELPYLKALRAVDEPLHQLRDLTNPEELERLGYHPYFRLISSHLEFTSEYSKEKTDAEKSAYSDLIAGKFPAADAHEQIIAEKSLPHFATPEDLFRECAVRLSTVHGAGVANIWSYRELHRAGILDPEAPVLEPILHYFGWNLSQDGDFGRFQGSGKLGVFCVSIAEGRFRGTKGLIPVTEKELDGLKSGSPVELTELSPISKDATFYLVQDTDARERLWKESVEDESSSSLTKLIDEMLEGMTRSERVQLQSIIHYVSERRRLSLENIMAALLSSQNPTARGMGARLDAAMNPSPTELSSTVSTVDILSSLGLDEDELRSAQDEVALEKARESMVQSMNSLCRTLISSFDRDFEANRKLVRDFVLGELDENDGSNPLGGVIRSLRNSDSQEARRIGARLIDGLATLDDGDEETAQEVHSLISAVQRTAVRIDELKAVRIPSSHITDNLRKLGVELKPSDDGEFYYGDCPFHEDQGSLRVSPEDEYFRCISCHHRGDSESLAHAWEREQELRRERVPSGVLPAELAQAAREIGVKLKKRPRADHYYGDCPFHEDHGNFIVSTVEDHFSCAHCGRSGGAEKLLYDFHNWQSRNRTSTETQSESTWDRPLNNLIEENYS